MVAARADGEASPLSSSSLSSEEEDMACSIPAVLRGAVDGGRHLRDASRNAAGGLASWTRQGGAFRALVVVSVGSVALVTLTGLLIVVFVLVAAATSAAAVSVLVSLAALSAFLAAAYVGALLVVVFVVSATTAATVIAITIATGWVAFFWLVWFASRKCVDLAIN
ncbi:hypothetical protein GUJ93_ZPchr0002g25971 [Zizania palustris]|uniref:Uncharacterized protein n=1 Tax=Zizania palustris TaxID=103762 RepID=A0A8J5VUQ4_ZIZPA|nr:hypothetical protein GUJ93_ZPchr0002g25971 [Zizania palustris]